MPYYSDDLVMGEILSYCGLKQVENKLTPGVYVFMEHGAYPLHVSYHGEIKYQLYLLSHRTEKYAWVSNNYYRDGWSEPRRIKIRTINGIETIQCGKEKGLPLTPKCRLRLDVIFTKDLWEPLTLQEKLERYLKMK